MTDYLNKTGLQVELDKLGFLDAFTPQELEAVLSPTEMTHPGIAGLSVVEKEAAN